MRRPLLFLIYLCSIVLISTACSSASPSTSSSIAQSTTHNSTINVASLRSSSVGDWPMSGYDPGHTGYVDPSVHPASIHGKLLWSHKFGPIFSSPMAGRGMIYVGSTDGYIYALKQDTGNVVWRVHVSSFLSDATPTLEGGVIFVATQGTAVEALNAYTGQRYWTYDTGEKVQAPPIAVGNRVLIASRTTLTALEATSGQPVWKFQHGVSGWPTTGSPALAGSTIYIGLGSGSQIWALNGNDGHLLWSFDTQDRITSSVIVGSDALYVATWHGMIFALNRMNGTRRWSYSLNADPQKTIVDGVGSNMALANGRLYIGDYRDSVLALDAVKGTLIWRYATGSQVLATPIVASNLVYVGSSDGNFYALDTQTGRPVWHYTTGEIRSSASLANGRLYVGSINGMMYAFV